MNAKRSRRILILCALAGAILVLGSGFYAVRRAQIRTQANESREAGLVAYEDGQYNRAAILLGKYVARYRDDAEVMYKYADAVTRTADTNPERSISPIAAWRAAVDVDPDFKDARYRLLDQYVEAGYNTEALELAAALLEEHPEDAEALWARAISLGQTRQFEPALEAARQYVQQKPTDMRGHILILQAMTEMGQPRELVLQQAAAYAQQRPDDPRGTWLLAMGHHLVGNQHKARQLVEKAAEGDPPTAEFAVRLALLLDRVGAAQRATSLLLDNADRFVEHEAFRLALARRLYETGRPGEVLQIEPSVAEIRNPMGEVVEALALLELGRRDDARQRMQNLSEQPSRRARRWANVLQSLYAKDPAEPAKAVQRLARAVRADPDEPYLRYLQGEAYMRAGEVDLAVDAWTKAAEGARAWMRPVLRGAEVLNALGRDEDAVKLAEAAHLRSPRHLGAAVLYAQLWEKNLDVVDQASAQKLQQFVDAIQEAVPGEPRTLSVSVRLSVRQGNIDAARQTMQDLLDGEDTPPKNVMLQMARLSRQYHLGLEEAFMDRYQEAYGRTPQLVYNQAVTIARQGNPDEGLRLINQAEQDGDPSWDVIRAQYYDYTDDDRATSEWRRLVEDYAGNRWIQRMALQSPSAWQDRALIDHTIERLQRLTGDEGIEWRLARGRWLLRGAPEKQAIANAIELLEPAARRAPNRAEPHVLLAAAYQLQGNLTSAVRELGLASTLQPASLDIALELGRLLQNQGEDEQSRKVLHRVVEDATATPKHLRNAAAMLAQLGQQRDLDDAIGILNSLEDREGGTPDVMLAILYRRNNRLGEAERVVRRLLDRPEPDVAAVEFAADFYASLGRDDTAKRALERLDDLTLPESEKLMIEANFLSRHVGVEEAVERMQQAIEADPQQYALWRNYIVYLLRVGRPDEALAALDDAKQTLGDLRQLDVLDRHRDLVKTVSEDPLNRGIVTTMVDRPAFRSIALEVLVTLGREARGEISAEQANRQLGAMADINSRFLPLQSLMVRRYLAADDIDEAVEIASRALGAFPSAIEAAWMASEAYSAAGRWPEALQAAGEWRRRSLTKPIAADVLVTGNAQDKATPKWSERSLNQPLASDLLIAKAQIELGNASAGLAQINPYVNQARQHPDRYAPIVLTQVRGLMRDGDTEQAREALRPLLSADPVWRKAWIEMAVRHLNSATQIESWLTEVSDHVAADDIDERVMLSQGWYSLWLATQNRDYLNRTLSILHDVTNREDASAQAMLALAMVLDSQGRRGDAEQYYRQALELNPALPAAQNNLAVILLESQDPADGAVELARQAVQQQPYNPDFLDTLALAESRVGNPDVALEHISRALDLEPNNLAWRLTQAEILASAGQTDDAQQVIRQINSDELPAPLSDRYNRLQNQVVQN